MHHPLYFEDVFTGERRGLELLQGRRVASLSGIAQPESFESKLSELGAEIVLARRYADHHRFTQQEVLDAVNRGKKRRADMLVTTQRTRSAFPSSTAGTYPSTSCGWRSRSSPGPRALMMP